MLLTNWQSLSARELWRRQSRQSRSIWRTKHPESHQIGILCAYRKALQSVVSEGHGEADQRRDRAACWQTAAERRGALEKRATSCSSARGELRGFFFNFWDKKWICLHSRFSTCLQQRAAELPTSIVGVIMWLVSLRALTCTCSIAGFKTKEREAPITTHTEGVWLHALIRTPLLHYIFT